MGSPQDYLASMKRQEDLRRKRKTNIMESIIPYLFISPFLISFVIFMVFPSIYTIVLSFSEYQGYGNPRFVGFLNYVRLFTYQDFWVSISNTLFYLLWSTIPIMIGAFLLAIAIYSKLTKWKNFYKIVIFLPQVMAVVAASLIWKIIFSRETGVINTLLGLHIPWLSDPLLLKVSVVVVLIWRATGWFFVVFLAGLASIPTEIYEAADIDGTSASQRLWHITLPLMRPILLFSFVINTISELKLYTEPNILLSSGGQASITIHGKTILNLLTENIQSGFFGLASAVGWILFVVIALLSFVQFKMFQWGGEE